MLLLLLLLLLNELLVHEEHLSLLFKLLRNGTLTIEQAAANNETSIPVLLDQLRNAGYDVSLKENGTVFGIES